MKLFRKKEETKTCCCAHKCSEDAFDLANQTKHEHGIKVLGTGCAKCITLEKNVKEALSQLQRSLEVQHIEDFTQIASYGVMTTPALIIDGKVVSLGKVLSVDEIIDLLKANNV